MSTQNKSVWLWWSILSLVYGRSGRCVWSYVGEMVYISMTVWARWSMDKVDVGKMIYRWGSCGYSGVGVVVSVSSFQLVCRGKLPETNLQV